MQARQVEQSLVKALLVENRAWPMNGSPGCSQLRTFVCLRLKTTGNAVAWSILPEALLMTWKQPSRSATVSAMKDPADPRAVPHGIRTFRHRTGSGLDRPRPRKPTSLIQSVRSRELSDDSGPKPLAPRLRGAKACSDLAGHRTLGQCPRAAAMRDLQKLSRTP